MIRPVRFESLPAMLCVGLRRRHPFADAVAGTAHQWREFAARGAIQGARGEARYGILCGADGESMEYMCGVEVADFDDAPADLGRIRIPAQQYAVFLHAGGPETLHETWRSILQTWLPASGYVNAQTPEFERYTKDPDTHGAGERIEVWTCIRKAGAE